MRKQKQDMAKRGQTALDDEPADIIEKKARKSSKPKSKKQPASKRVKKPAERETPKKDKPSGGRHMADTVKKATVKGVRWFNWYTYSQGGESKHSWLKIPFTFKFFIIASVVVIILMILALDNQSISVKNESISMAGLTSDLEGYKILLLSDMHASEFGDDQSALLRSVNAQKYDIMIITGDMVGKSGDYAPFISFLNGLNKTSNVYFIPGDSDPGPLREKVPEDALGEQPLSQLVLEDWIVAAMNTGANYLSLPKAITVGNNGTKFWLTPTSEIGVSVKSSLADAKEEYEAVLDGMLSGIDADYTRLPFVEYRYAQLTKLAQILPQMSNDELNISLSHVPPSDAYVSVLQDDHSDTVNDFLTSPDIILSGHYCGGVWRVPLYGAVYIPEPLISRNGWFPDQSYVRGQRSIGNTILYVTAGLGKTDDVLLPFRLFNTPEICLITLTGSLLQNTLIG